MTAELYKHLSFRTRQAMTDEAARAQIDLADRKVAEGRYFDALKLLRSCFTPARPLEAGAPAAKEEAA
jgi:flagellar biosynthesis regulator FlbT